jgi:integrase
MHIRHSTGGVRRQKGRWLGLWYEGGVKKSKVLGFVNEMSKGEAREAVAEIIAAQRAKQEASNVVRFGPFVENVFYKFYGRKWKDSTSENNKSRISWHLVSAFREREIASLQRDELQDLLDAKGKGGLSFSVVDHLRWDLKSILDMAVAEGHVLRNPATLLFTPKEAKKPVRRVMTIMEVQICFSAVGQRERLIVKLAVVAGMRPGEIFALTWGRLTATHADIQQRVYRRKIDTPKTENSFRQAALSEGLLREIEAWRAIAVSVADDAFVFPSERMTPLSRDNWWNRVMRPAVEKVGLEWATFQVLRRTHSTIMKQLKADPKLVADQLGHTVDVNLNVYTQSPVESRLVIVNQLERQLTVQ